MKQNDLKMKIDKIKKLLLENNIHIEQGLSDDEVRKIEKIYNVKFPILTFFFPCSHAVARCGISVPRSGIEPGPP